MLRRHTSAFVKFLIGAAAALLVGQTAHAQLAAIYPTQRLPYPPSSAPQPAQPARFGELAVTDGQTILVTVSEGPAAYTFRRNASGQRWIYDSALAPSEGTATGGGAVRGGIALVQGIIGSESVVFVFLRSQGVWSQTQTISAIVSGLSIGPDYIVISDLSADDFRGALFIYSESGAGTYVFDSKLAVADAGPGYMVGANPIADHDTVLAAAPGGATVSAFVRTGGFWSVQAVLGPTFGIDPFYAFSGNRAFLLNGLPGPPREFVRRNGTWTAGDELIHPQDPSIALFPHIAMDGRRVIAAEGSAESAFLFELGNGRWLATAELKRTGAGCAFGFKLSTAGKVATSTCPDASTGHPVFDGRVLVYELPQLSN